MFAYFIEIEITFYINLVLTMFVVHLMTNVLVLLNKYT
jgi:hypothetical protein